MSFWLVIQSKSKFADKKKNYYRFSKLGSWFFHFFPSKKKYYWLILAGQVLNSIYFFPRRLVINQVSPFRSHFALRGGKKHVLKICSLNPQWVVFVSKCIECNVRQFSIIDYDLVRGRLYPNGLRQIIWPKASSYLRMNQIFIQFSKGTIL